MLNKSIPIPAQANDLRLSQKYNELENLCPIEAVISKVSQFMFIVVQHEGKQHWLDGHCVLVPADLKKIQKVLPRLFSDKCLTSLSLKHGLGDKTVVC